MYRCKFAYDVKVGSDGALEKWKARLCFVGIEQLAGMEIGLMPSGMMTCLIYLSILLTLATYAYANGLSRGRSSSSASYVSQ